jgi:hypothetical protein
MQRDTFNIERATCQGNARAHRRSKRGKTRFPGIVWQASALGVTRHHLYQVLTGTRPSRSLIRRYEELTGRSA